MQIQDENMNTNDLSNFSINANSTNNSSTKKKDDKQDKQEKQKSNKRGLGSLLRKSTPKENTTTEDGTEHTELDTTQQIKLGVSKALVWCIVSVVISLIIIVIIILYMRHKKNVKQQKKEKEL